MWMLAAKATFFVLSGLSGTGATEDLDIGGQYQLPDNPYALDSERGCGLHCLLFLNSLHGGGGDFSTIARECAPGPFGVNMLSLQQAAESLGFHTRAVRADIEQLRELEYSAILHIDQQAGLNHFVAWLSWDEGREAAYVFDPPGTLDYRDTSWFHGYSGRAILISPDPIPRELKVERKQRDTAVVAVVALVLFCLVSLTARRILVKKRSVLGMSAVLLSFSVIGCHGESPPLSLQVEQQSDGTHVVDLGEIRHGQEMSHTFLLKNTTTNPVTVTDIQKSCKCQATNIRTGTVIHPGESLSFVYRMKTEGYRGNLSGRITISTDSDKPAMASHSYVLKAEVPDNLKAIPPSVVFGSVKKGSRCRRVVRVESAIPGLTEKFQKVSSGAELFSVTKLDSPKGRLSFEIALPQSLPVGEIRDVLRFQFDDDTYRTLPVVVYARVLGDFRIIPETVYVSAFSGLRTQSRRLRVSSTNEQPFRIKKIVAPKNILVDTPESAEPSFDLVLEISDPSANETQNQLSIYTDTNDVLEVQVKYAPQLKR